MVSPAPPSFTPTGTPIGFSGGGEEEVKDAIIANNREVGCGLGEGVMVN